MWSVYESTNKISIPASAVLRAKTRLRLFIYKQIAPAISQMLVSFLAATSWGKWELNASVITDYTIVSTNAKCSTARLSHVALKADEPC